MLKSPARIPDPWPMVRAGGRVGHKEGAQRRVKVKVWFPTLFTILSLPALGSALTKLLTQTFAHSQHQTM